MLKARLLSTVAAAMLLSAGAVSAQTMKDQAPERAPAAQQKAPAEKIAPAAKPGDQKAGAEQKAPQTTGQAAPKAAEPDKAQVKGQPADKGDKPAIKGASDTKGSMAPVSKDKNTAVESKEKNKAADSAAPAKPGQPAADKSKTTTTGQGAAATSAKLSPEQHTKVVTVFKQQRVAPVQLNISISVGTRVPQDVRFYPIPRDVIVIYPAWQGFDYIMVGNQILVLDPRTHEIVAILDA